MTIKEILKKRPKTVEPLDQELLIAHVLKVTREYVITHDEKKLSSSQGRLINCLIRKRAQGYPLAYLLGYKQFFGRDFLVNKYTLIPRPETELIIEDILKNQPTRKSVIDIGTGSGCLIITLQKSIEKNKNDFWATDISPNAIKLAKRNAQLYRVGKKIFFNQGSLLSPILKNKKFLPQTNGFLIVANLPYLSKAIWKETDNHVKKFEPTLALRGGHDGLKYYRRLLGEIKNLPPKPLTAYFEFSPEQKGLLKEMILSAFPKAKVHFFKDLSRRWRFVRWQI